MNELTNAENLLTTLRSLRMVRQSFGNFLKSLSENPKLESDEECDSSGQKLFLNFRMNLRELEKHIGGLTATANVAGSTNLSNVEILSLDPAPEKLHLYHQLLDCYTWADKVSNYSGMVFSNLNGNHLKRSNLPTKRKRPMPTLYDANAPPQTVDIHIQNMKNVFPDMTLNMVRPMGSNVVLQVSLGRVLKALVSFRGLQIEAVIVRGFNESHTSDDGKVDLFKQSEHKVFQKITDNANAAMLHFFTPGLVDMSIRSFFTWLNSYSKLFTEPCKKCNYHVKYNFPPTWRELRTLLPYHEECRP